MQLDTACVTDLTEKLVMGETCFVHKSTLAVTTYITPEDAKEWLEFEGTPHPFIAALEEVKANPDQYLTFEPLEEGSILEMMRAFVKEVKDAFMAEKLSKAIANKKPFVLFIEALMGAGEGWVLRWFKFRDQQYAAYITRAWEAQA